MVKKIMTLDSLYEFFVEQNQTVNFTSRNTGKPIVVTTDGFFETDDSDTPGMQRLELKVCHTETNRNGSHISKSNMEKAMPTLKYRPVLAYIHELEDGTKDFYAHNMEIVENEDGDAEINYIEKQVGCFTAEDPWLKYDEEKDKTYVHAYAVIPEGYTEAADIIRRKGGTKVSCELVINELSYNAKEKYLDLTDFYFGGCTLLGVDEYGNEIGEGMLGARADIADFCHKEPVYTYQDKLIETLEKLNITLSSFNKISEEGGNEEMDNFENVVVENEETTTDETVTVEETEEVVNEDVVVEESSTSETDDGEAEGETEESKQFQSKKTHSTDENGNVTISFEISHEDIRGALNNLICVYEEEDSDWYWVTNVYNQYFIFENWMGDKLYKQSYEIDGDNVALSGDRQEMFKMILTESEKLAIEKMREDYSALEAQCNELKAFKDNYDAAELKAQKDTIFAREEYSSIVETKAFKKLIEDSKDYTLEECEQRANSILEDCNDYIANFTIQDTGANKPKTIGFNFNAKPSKKKQAYCGLFEKDE